MQLIGPTSWSEVPARLVYDAADPFAVRIAFGDPVDDDGYDDALEDDGITWLMSRDLLREGLDRPAGEGDVRLWPARSAADVLYVHLRAPSGEALFEVSRATVVAFLRTTESLVPYGAEVGRLALDDALEVLLSGGGEPTGC